MKLRHLIINEIRFRRFGFLFGVLSVVVTIAVMVGAATLIQTHRQRTDAAIEQQHDSVERHMAQMRDDYRRYMKDMGHNSVIVHKDQSITQFLNTGRIDVPMPQAYAHTLAQSPRASYNHLLPVLQKRVQWPEYEVSILLCGTPGQIPVQAKPRFWNDDGYLDPIRPDIPDGHIEIGHALAEELELEAGQTVTLMGEAFTIGRILPAQGTLEDISVWCALADVQRWLDKPDTINVIFALECMGDAPALGGIVNHVPTVLADTHVLQFNTLVEARFDARRRASQATSIALDAERAYRGRMFDEYGAFSAILLPVVLAASAIALFGLFLDNVRRRIAEVGVLRAVGVKQKTVTALFMHKAIFTGLMGAVPGYGLGLLAGVWIAGDGLSGRITGVYSVLLFVLAMLAAPAWCVLAGWLPIRWAARQDPARILVDGSL